ncbi:MAG: RNA polymerase sigma factor [Acidobacteria bacterium]|nr:RNA polymerase sigma factor [Acidobacteriota bacterium]
MPEPLSDADLLGRSGSGAQHAFGRIVHRHGGPLYAIAYRWLDSAPDAEEVVQDAFLLLWRKRARIHLVGDSALPWLIVTVKHLAANRRRARIRRALHESEAAHEPRFSDIDTDGGAVADLLRQAFDALPPLDAQVARLCLVEDVTSAEAAARLGLSEGAVRNRLSRARARLRRDLHEQGVEDGR